jgi:hypothetical protein
MDPIHITELQGDEVAILSSSGLKARNLEEHARTLHRIMGIPSIVTKNPIQIVRRPKHQTLPPATSLALEALSARCPESITTLSRRLERLRRRFPGTPDHALIEGISIALGID